MGNEGTLTDEEKDLITKLFKTLKMAYNQLCRYCGLIGFLSYKLNVRQLLMVLKSSVRPLIQVNTLPGFAHQVTPRDRPTDHPEDKTKK